MVDMDEERYQPNLGTSLGFDDLDGDYLGADERVRKLTPGEETLQRVKQRAELAPTPAPHQISERERTRASVHNINREMQNELRQLDKERRKELRKLDVNLQRAVSTGALTTAEASARRAQSARAINQKYRQAMIAKKRDFQAKKVDTVDKYEREQKEAKALDERASKDRRLRSLEHEKRKVQAEIKEGRMPETTGLSIITRINQEIDSLLRTGEVRMTPTEENLRQAYYALRKKAQALSSAVAQALEVGSNYITFGDQKVPLKTAQMRLEGIKSDLAEKEGVIETYAPQEVKVVVTPTTPEGVFVPVGHVVAQMRYIKRLVNEGVVTPKAGQQELKFLDYVRKNHGRHGRIVVVDVSPDALVEDVPTGESYAFTESGSAVTRKQPVPNDIPPAIPHSTYRGD